jgi:hypothetical protein
MIRRQGADPSVADSLSCRTAPDDLRLSMERLVSRDPSSAAGWALALADDDQRRTLLEWILSEWAGNDAAASLAWARDLDDPGDRESALAAVALGTSAHHPEMAMAIATEIGRDDLIRHCLRDWSASHPRQAASYCQGMEEGPGRAKAVLDVAAIWARNDPAAAASFVLESIGDDHLDQAVLNVVAQAPPADLPLLREWIANFPECPLKQLAQAELARIERLLPFSPASLPGEDQEDRTPLTVTEP